MSSASDDFNRADAADLGASWTTQSGAPNSLQIIANTAAPQGGTSAGGDGNYYSGTTWSGDHSSQATFTGAALADAWQAVRVRCQSGADTYYSGGCDFGDNGNQNRRIWKTVAGTRTSLASEAIVIALGDVVYLEANGTTLTLTINGVVRLTVTDAAISGGSPGLGSRSSSPVLGLSSIKFDDWSGADLVGAAATLDEDGEWMITTQSW